MGVDHDVNAVDSSALFGLHLGDLDACCDESISQHLFDLGVNFGPLNRSIVLLEFTDEIFILDLLELAYIPIVHHCELGFIRAHRPSVQSVGIV